MPKKRRVWKLCTVCYEEPIRGIVLCDRCGKAYDRMVAKTSTIAELIEWSAKRARMFERKRSRMRRVYENRA